MILIIDNYDSFTYNLFQQISMLGKNVKVVRNDAITIEEIQKMSPEAIVLSPGPGTPAEAGITVNVIEELYQKFPILGICLGHQSIGFAFGANIVQAQTI
ncbi:Para-aminobenzoate synthase component II, partial [Bacillus sp. B14905]